MILNLDEMLLWIYIYDGNKDISIATRVTGSQKLYYTLNAVNTIQIELLLFSVGSTKNRITAQFRPFLKAWILISLLCYFIFVNIIYFLCFRIKCTGRVLVESDCKSQTG